jgi:ketosteroid isomerase-like protein
MSQENVDIVRRAAAAFNRRDVAEALSAFDPDVKWDVSRDIWGPLVGGGEYHGVDGILSWRRELNEAFRTLDLRYEDEVIGVGDKVVAILSARGRGLHSDLEVEHHPANVTTLVAGKIVAVVWYPTRDDALEAVGLAE